MSIESKFTGRIKKGILSQLRAERGLRRQTIGQISKVLALSCGVIDTAELHGKMSWKLIYRWLNLYHKEIEIRLKDKT